MTGQVNPMDREAWGERLNKIEVRYKSATPGPWTLCNPESAFKNWPIGFFSLGRDELADPKNWAVSTDHVHASQMVSGGAKEDAEFIAHARQDIPDLVAYARALQSQLTEALAEVERLRAAIDLSRKTLKDAPEINARRIDNRPPDIGCDFVLWVKGAGYDDSFVLRNPRMNNGYAECILRALESVGEVQKILREARQPK